MTTKKTTYYLGMFRSDYAEFFPYQPSLSIQDLFSPPVMSQENRPCCPALQKRLSLQELLPFCLPRTEEQSVSTPESNYEYLTLALPSCSSMPIRLYGNTHNCGTRFGIRAVLALSILRALSTYQDSFVLEAGPTHFDNLLMESSALLSGMKIKPGKRRRHGAYRMLIKALLRLEAQLTESKKQGSGRVEAS